MNLYEAHDLMEMELGAQDFLVDGIISANDKVLCVARYKAGKSIWSQQLAHCYAGGHDFLGFRVREPGKVLYIAGEGDLDDLQLRSQAMSRVLPMPKDSICYWPMPSFPLNTSEGRKELANVVEQASDILGQYPNLTIYDPAYTLMSGSPSDDAKVSEFLRVVRGCQDHTKGAVVVMHHTHRAIRNQKGEVIEEGDESFFGSMLWKAWPRTVYMIKVGPHDERVWSCDTHRRNVALDEPLELTLIEPWPLEYVIRDPLIDPTMATIIENLKFGPLTQAELREVMDKKHATIVGALGRLETQKLVTKSQLYGGAYSLMEVNNVD